MNILVLPGDDIGPEITAAAIKVLERAKAVYSLDLEFVQLGGKCGTHAFAAAVVAQLEKSATRLTQTA